MSRSWYLRGFVFLVLIVGAVGVLVPTLLPYEHQPEIFRRHFQRKIQPGLDIQGGLRLVFDIDLDRLLPMVAGATQGEVDKAAVHERAIVTAIERIESSMGPFRCADEKVFREGDRIVVELPGLSQQSNRIRSFLYGLTSRLILLRLVVVDDESEYMHMLASSVPDGGAIEVVVQGRCREDAGTPCPRMRAP